MRNRKDKKIIVLSGKQFSGKDTAAAILIDVLEDFTLAPLASAIKEEFGKEKNLVLNEIERNKPMYRPELISLGNKRRAEDINYWINKVLEKDGNIIVSDVRFAYELETFKKYDAISIRVEASREARAERGKLVKEDDPTEIDLDNYKKWDFVVENNSDYESFRKKVLEMTKSIQKEFSRVKL